MPWTGVTGGYRGVTGALQGVTGYSTRTTSVTEVSQVFSFHKEFNYYIGNKAIIMLTILY